MSWLQLILPKKDIQESKSRGGKWFRLDNCQNKDCVYVHVWKKSFRNASTIVVFLETDICSSSLVLVYPVTFPSICFTCQDYAYLLK